MASNTFKDVIMDQYKVIGWVVMMKSQKTDVMHHSRFFPSYHDATHCLKQWKEQFAYMGDFCYFDLETVYTKEKE